MNREEILSFEKNYLVVPYNIEQFKEILLATTKITIEELDKKLENNYYKDYFEHVSCKTMVIEKEYVDKDFLKDFSNYYVTCFQTYNRFCTRIHFFSSDFNQLAFEEILSNTTDLINIKLTELNNSYLGFIVIKNLPKSIIGKTCLKIYSDSESRNFPVLQKYEAHLAGIPLKISTLAFQEQDSVVAACATSSLWSIFQGTGRLFHHPILSPFEITQQATKDFPTRTRVFPNSGLTLEMMSKAIKNVGLEPLFINTNNQEITKAAIYAYLKSNIPIMMGFYLQNKNTKSDIGLHAVAITGYNLPENCSTVKYTANSNNNLDFGITLKSFQIDKIYVHDDQVGPFAKMEFNEISYQKDNSGQILRNKETGAPITTWALSTSWGMKNLTHQFVSKPFALLIPTYHKIRIPFEKILMQVYAFNNNLNQYAQQIFPKANSLISDLVWDIHLTTVNDLKKELLYNSNITSSEKLRINMQSLPKYIWKVRVYKSQSILLDMLFDATDIEQNNYMLDIIKYDESFVDMLKKFSLLFYNAHNKSCTDNIIIQKLSAMHFSEVNLRNEEQLAIN